MPVEITISNGMIALVDEQDAGSVQRYIWTPQRARTGKVYAYRWISRKKPRTAVTMHQQVLGVPSALGIDHWDGNGLNNCRSNLRIATQRQNSANRLKRPGSTSIYKGVLLQRGRSWIGCMKWDSGTKYLGTFATEEDAAHAYDVAARERYGEFGTYNFPLPGERSALTGLIEPLHKAAA